ncbi:hypothetical protein [Nocardia gipuzkoensis]|uniref:hypothetical protein n=1 Tax=Nocardia gipuzkoensis TaxID=2749991 RepID=UPI00237E19B0|nr:hypothetical protein [Nocardia gipuzkoensis]MDE1673807.1 hypothetical protein [Nocardia gipuzkoensis]
MPDQITGRPTDEELRQIAEDPWVTYAPDIPRRMAIELRELRVRVAGLEDERDEALGRYDLEYAARTGAEYGAHAARETRNRVAAKLRSARARVAELEAAQRPPRGYVVGWQHGGRTFLALDEYEVGILGDRARTYPATALGEAQLFLAECGPEDPNTQFRVYELHEVKP